LCYKSITTRTRLLFTVQKPRMGSKRAAGNGGAMVEKSDIRAVRKSRATEVVFRRMVMFWQVFLPECFIKIQSARSTQRRILAIPLQKLWFDRPDCYRPYKDEDIRHLPHDHWRGCTIAWISTTSCCTGSLRLDVKGGLLLISKREFGTTLRIYDAA
jgi:hypothetical protein